MYLIYSVKMNGWITAAGIYTSEVKDAKRFSRADAIRSCRVHYSGGNFGWVPVYENDLKHVQQPMVAPTGDEE